MNRIHYILLCALVLFLMAGCATQQHNILGNQSMPNFNTESGILSRQHQVILERAMKDTDYHCKYPKLAETVFAQNIIDAGLFQNAYKTTHGFKASDHLYTTNQAQALLKERENKLQRIAQLQNMRGRGNQMAIQELNREIQSIEQILGAARLNQALVEHQQLKRKWIDTAISRTARLNNSDATYSALAELDVDLEKYGRMCSDWRPRYYGDKGNFPTTTEKTDLTRLRKAVEDKMYTILMSDNSAIADQINTINTFRDLSRFFGLYIIMNGGASSNALKRAGLYDIYDKRRLLAIEWDRNIADAGDHRISNNQPDADDSKDRKSGEVSANEPSEKEMLSALQGVLDGAGQQAAARSESCKYLGEGNNPLVALDCMFGSIQKEAQRSISITGFEKIGCAKARATGYICDYRIKIAGPMTPNTWSPVETRRFIKTQRGWVIAN